MLAASPSEIVKSSGAERRAQSHGERATSQPVPVRRLAPGEILFQAGDAQTHVYRVESGALCQFVCWHEDSHEILGFAQPGDIIGFEPGATHANAARALIETVVRLVPVGDIAQTVQTDRKLAYQLAFQLAMALRG